MVVVVVAVVVVVVVANSCFGYIVVLMSNEPFHIKLMADLASTSLFKTT